MAGEIQVNSVTALTESGSNIVLNNVDTATNRTNLGLGSIATQAADSVAITGGNISNTTLASTNRGGIFLIDEQTVTAQATVTYTLPSTTNVFYFIIYTSFYSSATDTINLLIRDSSNTAFTVKLAGQRNWSDGSSPTNLDNTGATSQLYSTVYNDSVRPSYAKLSLHYGSASYAPHYEVEGLQINNSSAYSFYDQKAAYATTAGTVDNIQFDVAGAATMTGSFKVYGVKI
jgi:hypothetical protein